MRGDEHSEMSPSLGFDGLAVCIVQSANLIPRLSTERFGLRGRQRRGEWRGEKIGESKRKALINLISTHMLDAVRQILDNLELMAINVSFICRQKSRWRGTGSAVKWQS